MDYREEIINSLVEVCKKARSEGFDSAREIYTKQVDSGYKKGLEDAWECARKTILGTAEGGIHADDLYEMFGTLSASEILESVSINEAMQKIKEYERQKQKCESCFIEKLTKEKWASAKDCKKCTKEISAECVVDGCEFEPKQDKKLCDRCKNSKLCELNYTKYKDNCSDFYPKTDATDINDGSIKVGDEVRIKGSDPVKNDCDYGICTRSLPNVNTIYVMRRDGSSGEENKDEWYRTGRFFPQVAEVLKLLKGKE